MEGLEKVKDLLAKDRVEEAKNELQNIVVTDAPEYLLLKGKIEQKFQNWGEAINAYNKLLKIEPENTEAKNNLELINNILNFWNPDLFNP